MKEKGRSEEHMKHTDCPELVCKRENRIVRKRKSC
jgi:hypothetical protein